LEVYADSSYDPRINGERYDPRTNKWTEIPSMRCRRRSFATVVMDDKIFAIGGYKRHTRLNSVHYFDKRTNQWFVYLLL
jgi:N-acetylneuraminic acid mutarotase